MRILAALPARLESTRLPRKLLRLMAGKPLLWHTWSRVGQAQHVDDVVVVTDSVEIATAVSDWGGRAIMSPKTCRSGTERLATIRNELEADVIINVQGDEALIDPATIDRVVLAWEPGMTVLTPVVSLKDAKAIASPNIVKVARSTRGQALYFSRSPVPYQRDTDSHVCYWGHIGIYCYSPGALQAYLQLPECELEWAEKLEQLRWLDAGYRIDTCEIASHQQGIDTMDDFLRVEAIFQATASGLF